MSLSISISGARPGDIIKGTAAANKDIYAYVCNPIKPNSSAVRTAVNGKKSDITLNMLGTIRAFANRSKEERKSLITAESV